MSVPLISQRYQLQCILLTKRVQLPESSPLAKKWSSPGRFSVLLKEVDELVNGVWASCLTIIEYLISVIWIVIMCSLVLASMFDKKPESVSFGVYVGLFLGLGVLVMVLPFFWFILFIRKLQDCETMVREGQALYMSAVGHAIMPSFEGLSGSSMVTMANGANGVVALATFRAFFFRLAMTTNYSLFVKLWIPFVAYFLLTIRSFGQSIASAVIVLLSLRDFANISGNMLSLLTTMSKGCLVLQDVSELLNAELVGTTHVEDRSRLTV